ncbi:MAG: 3D domain-containing protein [Clostridiales bacterium]|nr:3D domain-containing protein [Clostridiales bacterium]
MFDKSKKHLLAVLTASLLLTFSGGICAFADENVQTDTSSISGADTVADDSSSADASIADTSIIEETADTDAADDSDKADSTNNEETSHVIVAGNSGQKTQTDATGSGTDAEDTTGNETEESTEDASAEDSDDDADDGLISLGVFRTTAYCPCYACSEGYGRHTCTGATARSGHTIAVDPRVIPFGSKVLINGVVYTAEDRGGAVRGNHIDIFFDNHAQTWQYGTRTAEVFLLA